MYITYHYQLLVSCVYNNCVKAFTAITMTMLYVSILLYNTYTIGYRYYSLIPSSDTSCDIPSRGPYPYIVTKRQGQVSCVPLSVVACAFWDSYMYTVHVHV